MTNEEFQKAVLEKLSQNDEFQRAVLKRLDNIETSQDKMDENLYNLKTRQDEIYEVVKAIEHSNQVGRAELDRHDFSIAEVKGILKKAGKIIVEELDEVSNL